MPERTMTCPHCGGTGVVWISGMRAWREHRGLTLDDLRDKTGITPSHLSSIERGLKKPGLGVIYKLMDALDCTLEELFPRNKASK